MSRDNKIIVYVHKKCIPCKKLLEYFRKTRIQNYKVIEVDREEIVEELKSITGGEAVVPLTLNPRNGKMFIGCPKNVSEFIKKINELLE